MARNLLARGAAVFAVAAFSAGSAIADVTLTASVDKTQVALNDSFRVLVTVAGDAANLPAPQMPDLSAFAVYSSGRAQNVSFVNGQISSSVNHTYMLTPKSAGKFTIGAFSVTVDGKTIQSAPIPVEVLPSGQSPAGGAALGTSGRASAQPGQPNAQAPGAFVKLTLDKSKAMVNEQVALMFRFYHRVRLAANPQYQPPDMTGFLTEDLPPPRNFTESVNGIPYSVTEIKTALFPTRDGTLTLSPARLAIAVQDFSGGSPDDFFEQFFRGGAREYRLQTEPVKLTVTPLPAGKPADFSGGVGEFSIAMSVDKSKPAVGDPITLTVTVSGKGNIKSLGDPAFPDFDGFRKYDTASSLNIDTSRGTVEGSKVYKIVLVPQTSGTHGIPPIRFSYFHVASRSYKTIATQPVSIDVAPGKSQSFAIGPGAMPPQIASVSREIRYIRQDAGDIKPFVWFNRTRLFLILHLLPALGLLAGIGHRVRLAWIARDPARRRAEGALRKWQAALKNIKPGEADAAGEIFQAFQEYFSDKMLAAETSPALKDAAAFLERRNVQPELTARLKKIWSDFEQARYAPAQFRPQDVDRMQNEADALLRDVDAALRKNCKAEKVAAFLIPALLPLLLSLNAGASLIERFKAASDAYQSGQFETARAQYESIAAEAGANFAVEYNLGNTYHKLGMTGKAITHWLRAQRMRPLDGDTRANLQLAGAQTGESFEPGSWIGRTLNRLWNLVNLNLLSAFYLSAFWILCIHWTLILLSNRPIFRAGGFLSLAIFIAMLGWWMTRLRGEQWQSHAVIVQQNAEVRSGPGERFRVGFTVPEGRLILILNEGNDGWTEIGIPQAGVRGWARKNAFEKI